MSVTLIDVNLIDHTVKLLVVKDDAMLPTFGQVVVPLFVVVADVALANPDLAVQLQLPYAAPRLTVVLVVGIGCFLVSSFHAET